MHLAHIKVGRLDESYFSTFSNVELVQHENRAFESIKDLLEHGESSYGYGYFHRRDKVQGIMEEWENIILTRGIDSQKFFTGYYTIESREIELDVLSKGTNIYVKELGGYHKVVDVEVNLDNSVNYYIDFNVTHNDENTSLRIVSVEEWFEAMYPHLETYNDLIHYEYEKHPIYETFNKYKEFYELFKSDIVNINDFNYYFGVDIIKEVEPEIENKEKTDVSVIDSNAEYVEVKENHYVPSDSINYIKTRQYEDSGRASFAMAMLSVLFIVLFALCLVVNNL